MPSLFSRWASWWSRWFVRPSPAPTPPPRPARFALSAQREVFTPMLQLKVSVHLPTLPSPNDIASQSLSLTVNGGQPAVTTIPLATADYPLGLFNPGDVLSASLSYTDVAGNVGPATIATLTVADTFPPPAPGPFSLSVTGEVITADPAPTPAPVAPPAPAVDPNTPPAS